MATNDFWRQAWPVIWHISWQASVLAGFVLAAQKLFRDRLSPQWRLSLWWLVVLRLMLPVIPESTWSIFNLAPSARAQQDAAKYQPVARPRPPINPMPFPVSLAQSVKSAPQRQGSAATLNSFKAWNPVLSMIWITGAVVFGGWLLTGCALIYWRLRKASPVRDEAILAVFEDCRQKVRLAQAPQLFVTDAVESPALFGWWRGKLLVPSRLLDTFDLEDWRHVFLHELTHIRRGDLARNWLWAALQAIHWFNPVLWHAFSRMRLDRELACDAEALSLARDGDSRAYGRTILRLLRSLNRPAFAPGMVGILEDKRQITERIQQIAGHSPAKRGLVLAAALLALFCLCLLTDALTRPRGSDKLEAQIANSPVLGKNDSLAVLFKQVTWSRNALQNESSGPNPSTKIVRQMGLSAVPFLIEQLRIPNPDTAVAVDRRRRAVWVLGELAPEATNALPALTAALSDGGSLTVATPTYGAQVHGVPVSLFAAEALGKYGVTARSAIPALLEAINRGQSSAMTAILLVDPDTPELIETLTVAMLEDRLDEENGIRCRLTAMVCLAQLGEMRKEAVLALMPMIKEPRYADEAMKLLVANQKFKDLVHQEIQKALENSDPADHASVAAGLVCAGRQSPELLESIIESVKAGAENFSEPVFKALAIYGSRAKAVTPYLVELLTTNDHRLSEDAGFAGQAINALASVGKEFPGTAEVIGSFITNWNSSLRQEAIMACEKHGYLTPQIQDSVLKSCQDSDRWVRITAVERLKEFKIEPEVALPILTKTLSDPEASYAAMYCLEKYGPLSRALVQQIIPLLSASKDSSASTAAYCLANCGTNTDLVVPALLAAFENSTLEGVPNNAAVSLGKLGAPAKSAIPALEKALPSAKGMLQCAIADALRKLDGRLDVVPILIDRVRDVSTWDRGERLNKDVNLIFFINTLEQIGPPAHTALPVLRQTANTNKTNIVRACQAAITAIEGKTTLR